MQIFVSCISYIHLSVNELLYPACLKRSHFYLYLINPSPGRVKFSQREKINIDSPARGARENINVVQAGKIDLSARRRR